MIRALAQQLGAEVHLLTKKAFAPIALANPFVKKVFALSGDLQELIPALKAEQYDHVVDLHHNLRSFRVKSALGVSSTSFDKLNIEKWLLVNLRINRLPDLHIVDRYMESVRSLGISGDGEGLDFFIPEDRKVDTEKAFGVVPGTYISLVIGAAHPTKCMMADQLSHLCDLLDRPVILIGGKEEVAKANLVLAGSRNTQVRSAVGMLDIMQSASVLGQAAHVITHDTGMMHIAAALKKEQTVIWGNTIPEFGMYPYYGHHKVPWRSFEIAGLACRPCSKLGFEKCPKGHFKCMLQQDLPSIASLNH